MNKKWIVVFSIEVSDELDETGVETLVGKLLDGTKSDEDWEKVVDFYDVEASAAEEVE